jgi:hypothetical protein
MMFGEIAFSDSTFSDILANFTIIYVRAHGRTQVEISIEDQHGYAVTISPDAPGQNYKIRSKVEKDIVIKTDSRPFS